MRIEDVTQTKDGTPVRIYATDGGSGKNMVHGAIRVYGGWQQAMWCEDGKQHTGPVPDFPGQFYLDLHDWRDDIPWQCLKEEVQWVAMDDSNHWFGYSKEPTIKDDFWAKTGGVVRDLQGIKMPTPPDWQNSKTKRPEER